VGNDSCVSSEKFIRPPCFTLLSHRVRTFRAEPASLVERFPDSDSFWLIARSDLAAG